MGTMMQVLDGSGLWQTPLEIAALGAIFALVDLVIDIRSHTVYVDGIRLLLKLVTMIILFVLLDTLPALGTIGNNIINLVNEPFTRGFWLILFILMPYMVGRLITQSFVNLAMGRLKPDTPGTDNRKAKAGTW